MAAPVDYAALTERRCSKCKLTKPVEDFNRYADPKAALTGWRYYSQCRACQKAASSSYGKANRPRRNERLRRWRQDNAVAARAADRRKRLASKYRLTEEEHAALFARFDGRCWVCRVRPAILVEHSHATGEVRGASCGPCNGVLAQVDNVPGFLDLLAEYLAGL